MELEAENLWIHSASHDFDDKKNHQKILFFLVDFFRRKLFNFFKKYFQNRKFSLKSQYRIFEEKNVNIFRENFRLFSKISY